MTARRRYKNPTPCSVDGCDTEAVARLLCAKHRARWRRHGDPNVVKRGPGSERNARKLCTIDDCGRNRQARGLCAAHYTRWRMTGVRGGDIAPSKSDLATRFWAKVEKNGPVSARRPDLGKCWIWTGAIASRYGTISVDGRNTRAHRVSFELAGGVIPEGLVLDHLCSVTICVNPKHLEPVTQGENIRRARR